MRCEKFDLCLIVPFQYDKNWFEQMGNEPGLLEYFEEKEMKSDRLEQKNYKIWNERKHGIMRCFELRQKYRMTIGVYKNENYVYSFCKKDDIHFQISKIYGWFLETGEAFLTLRVSGKDLSEEQMMDLKSMLTRIRERHKIQYSIKTGKDTSEEKCFTMKELIRNFLEKVEFVGPTELKNTYSEAVCLSYGIVEGMEQHHILELSENLKNNIKSARKSSQIIEPEFCYIPREFPYLYWSVSENCLSVLADISQAAEMANENVVFLRDNLGASIFKNYLMFYLYYYSLQVRCLKLETQYQMAGKKMCMYPAKVMFRNWKQIWLSFQTKHI